MNVAFPAILLFLLLSPGIVFHWWYQPREVRVADMSPLGKGLLIVAFAGLAADAVVMLVASGLLGYEFHLGQMVRLLVDGRSANQDDVLASVFSRLDHHPAEPVLFFITANAIAALRAVSWRFLVWKCKLDHPSFRFFAFVRPPAPWNYLFRGTDVSDSTPDAVVVAALVPLKDATYLYTGILVDYELTDKGELDRIVLSNAARRNLDKDRKKPGTSWFASDDDRFYPIEGDCLVLRASEFTTLNIKFLVLQDLENADSAESPPKRDA